MVKPQATISTVCCFPLTERSFIYKLYIFIYRVPSWDSHPELQEQKSKSPKGTGCDEVHGKVGKPGKIWEECGSNVHKAPGVDCCSEIWIIAPEMLQYAKAANALFVFCHSRHHSMKCYGYVQITSNLHVFFYLVLFGIWCCHSFSLLIACENFMHKFNVTSCSILWLTESSGRQTLSHWRHWQMLGDVK